MDLGAIKLTMPISRARHAAGIPVWIDRPISVIEKSTRLLHRSFTIRNPLDPKCKDERVYY